MKNTEERKIYDLLQSRNEGNIILALELAKGLDIDLTGYWQDLRDYLGERDNEEELLERLFDKRYFYGYQTQKGKIKDTLHFLKWAVNVTLINLSRMQLEELPEAVIKNHKLESLNISENNLSKLPTALAYSNIKTLNVSFNPKLDFEQLWQIIPHMSHLTQLKWLSNCSVNFNAGGQTPSTYTLSIHFHPSQIHYPDKLVKAFPYLTTIKHVIINLNPPGEYDYKQLPPAPKDVQWACFPDNFFESFMDLEELSFQGIDWDWKHTFELLSTLPKLRKITVNCINAIYITIDLTQISFKIYHPASHKQKRASQQYYPYLYGMLDGLTLFKGKINKIDIPNTLYFPKFPESLSNSIAVKTLEFRKLRLEQLPKGLLNCPQLKTIDLSYNPSIDWANETIEISNLTQLEVLNLSHNQIKTFETSSISCNTIHTLDLSHNQLQFLPDWIRGLNNLKVLKIHKNHLKQLPDWLTELPLEELYISNNKLDSLYTYSFDFPNLKVLHIDNNQLHKIPKNILQLPKLEVLGFSNNPLEKLSPQIANIPHLEQLILNNCGLENIPMELAKMTQLKKVFLANNKLKTFPKAIRHLSNLRSLGLAFNQIESAPSIHLPELRYLNLNGNYLKQLPQGIEQSTQINHLRANLNPLESFPTIPSSYYLILDLDYTRLKSLGNNTFKNTYINISLRSVKNFDWYDLYKKVENYHSITIFWLKNRRLNPKELSHFDFRNQGIKDWTSILQFLKKINTSPRVLLQGNHIEHLGDEWKGCNFISELYLRKNPKFDVPKSLEIFATMKGLKRLYLDYSQKKYHKELQEALGKSTKIKFKG